MLPVLIVGKISSTQSMIFNNWQLKISHFQYMASVMCVKTFAMAYQRITCKSKPKVQLSHKKYKKEYRKKNQGTIKIGLYGDGSPKESFYCYDNNLL